MNDRDTPQSRRVLIVDDDDHIRKTLRDILEAAGYEIAEAADGVEALDQMRAHIQPCAVLLDMRMPRLDGSGVLRAVAADETLAKHHAIVVVTAELPTLTAEVHHLLQRLGAPVLMKPFELDDLFAQVERAERRLREA